MKRVELVKALEAMGRNFIRHGGRHDWYSDPATGASQPVSRHREIEEQLARRILGTLGRDPASEGERPR